jgi:hypothetical protein
MATDTRVDDDGYAFTHNEKDDDGSHYHSHCGMSLRDWFAGQALTGILAYSNSSMNAGLAKSAYALADAMLVAREDR